LIEKGKAVPTLVPLLQHSSVKVRCHVADDLRKIRTKAALVGILEARQATKDPELIVCYSVALHRGKSAKALDAIVPLLADVQASPIAIHALTQAGTPSVSAIDRMLSENPSDLMIAGVMGVISEMGEPGSKWLVEQLQHPSIRLRHAVLGTLRAVVATPLVARQLAKLARSGRPEVRARAIDFIASSGDTGLLTDARVWLEDDNPTIRAAAARVFEAMPVVSDHDRLVRRYQSERLIASDKNLGVRVALLRAMGNLKSADLVPTFVDAFGYEGEQQAAIDALVSVGAPAARTLLLVVKAGDLERAPFALEALARLGSGVGMAAKGLFTHPRETIRNLARDLMSASNDPDAVDALIGLFRKEEYEDPVPLIEAIGSFDGPGARKALLEVLQHADPRARRAAAEAFGRMHRRNTEVLSALQDAVEKDDNLEVKLAAIRGMYRLYDPRLSDLLVRLIQFEGPSVRMVAYDVLSWIGAVTAVPLIASKIGDAEKAEREVIFRSLARLTRTENIRSVSAANAFMQRVRAKTQRRAAGRLGTVKVEGTTLNYRVAGSGPVLIAISDMHSGDMFQSSLDRLSGSRRVVTYDGRGRGKTELGSTPYSLSLELADIEALRTAVKAEKVTLLGHGYGGLIALAYAQKHPGKVTGVVMVSTPAKVIRYGSSNNAKRQIPKDFSSDISELDAKHAWFSSEAWIAYRHVALQPGLVYQPAQAPYLSMYPIAPVIRQLVETALGKMNVTDSLAAVGPKVSVILGEKSTVSIADRAVYDKTISAPNSRVFTVAQSGDYPHIESPDAFVQAVRRAVSSVQTN
jgi:proline iminopeptidase